MLPDVNLQSLVANDNVNEHKKKALQVYKAWRAD
jgi:hypothetical protein